MILMMLLLLAHERSKRNKLSYSMITFIPDLSLIVYFLLRPSCIVFFKRFSLTRGVYSLKRLLILAFSYLASWIVTYGVRMISGSSWMMRSSGDGIFEVSCLGWGESPFYISFICSSIVLKWVILWRLHPYLSFYHLWACFSNMSNISIK